MRKKTFRQAFMKAAERAKESGYGAFFIVGYLEADFPKESRALEDVLRERKELLSRSDMHELSAGIVLGD